MNTNPYASFLDQLEKPARYIGGEYFSAHKSWEENSARVALCFPDAYEIGMSHLGFKILYEELNKTNGILADRVFAPWIDMEAKIRENELSLVSLENFKPLSEFMLLGFSLQYELTYTNILQMLELGGVSVWQADRKETEPLVICGGPCATHPEPLAPFMDIVVIGDGEDLFVRLVQFVDQARKMGIPRSEILKQLASWSGLYIPSLYSTEICPDSGFEVLQGSPKIHRFMVEDLSSYPIPTRSPIPHMTAIFDRFSVELARGCTEGCRFCQAGMIYRPVRERRPNDVIESVVQGMQNAGFQEASLTCLSTADYSAITPLLIDLLDKISQSEGSTLGVSSLRAYGLDEKVLDKMAEVKNSSLTFAPEAGTERMRKVINKNISESDMLKTAHQVFERGWRKMKLYFMIGLPTETDEDVIGIMETARKAKAVAKEYRVRNVNVTVSASSFVPKPHTPFQWSNMISFAEIERKQEMLYVLSRQYGLNFRKHTSKASFIEGIVARGDRRIAEVIYSAYKKGARFDGWNETFNFDTWMQAIEENQIDPMLYLGTLRLDARLPWDHIDVGLEDKFLLNEWKRALKDRLSPPCGKPNKEIVHYSNLEQLEQAHDVEKKKLVCYNCGIACDLTGMVEERREFLTSLKAFKEEAYQKPEKTVDQMRKEKRDRMSENISERFIYRICYAKLGSLSFISHLDLQTVIARVFKRANLEVVMSSGYNPSPKISFGPALTLGVSSLNEFFDVRVPQAWENPDEVLKQLQQHSEKGLFFQSVKRVESGATSIQAMTKQFKYYVPVNNAEEIGAAIEKFETSEEWTMPSYNKKKKQKIEKNIKPFVAKLESGEFQTAIDYLDLIDEVSPVRGRKGIFVTTNVLSGSSLRPIEIGHLFEQLGLSCEKPIKMEVIL